MDHDEMMKAETRFDIFNFTPGIYRIGVEKNLFKEITIQDISQITFG